MNKKIKLEEMIAYDFSNLDLPNSINDNCFTCEAEPCVCDCDCDDGCNDNCDVDGYCDF